MEKCLANLKVGGENYNPEYEERKRKEILEEYERSLEHKYVVPPHGIQGVNVDCAYPIHVGDVKSTECKDALEGGKIIKFISNALLNSGLSHEKIVLYLTMLTSESRSMYVGPKMSNDFQMEQYGNDIDQKFL